MKQDKKQSEDKIRISLDEVKLELIDKGVYYMSCPALLTCPAPP
jgi:hypothetical protein